MAHTPTSFVGAWELQNLPADRDVALTEDSQARKDIPMARGLLDYFPAALAEVAAVSQFGNDKHNPGEELHHARGKSMDHADCIVRHLVDRGKFDDQGIRHSAYVAWRALALLQQELEDAGEAPLARGARLPLEYVYFDEIDQGCYDCARSEGCCLGEIVTASRPGLKVTQWRVVAERPPQKGERYLSKANSSAVLVADYDYEDVCKVVVPA